MNWKDVFSLLSLTPDTIQLFLRHHPSFATEDNDVIDIKILPIVKSSLINQKDPKDCFVVDYVVGNANLAKGCIQTLTEFVATSAVQSK